MPAKAKKAVGGKAGAAIQAAAVTAQGVAATGALGEHTVWVMLGIAMAQAVAAVYSQPVGGK